MPENSIEVALKIITGISTVTVIGVNNAGGKVFLRSKKTVKETVTASLTLLSAGVPHVKVYVTPQCDFPLTFFAPSRWGFRQKAAHPQTVPSSLIEGLEDVKEPVDGSILWYTKDEQRVINGEGKHFILKDSLCDNSHVAAFHHSPHFGKECRCGCLEYPHRRFKRAGRQFVYTDASLRRDGSNAFGWLTHTGTNDSRAHIMSGVESDNSTRLEMEAIVMAVAGNTGNLWVHSDCLQAVEALSGNNRICKKTEWGKDLLERFCEVSKNKIVNLLWIPAHGSKTKPYPKHATMNHHIDTLVRTASLHAV